MNACCNDNRSVPVFGGESSFQRVFGDVFLGDFRGVFRTVLRSALRRRFLRVEVGMVFDDVRVAEDFAKNRRRLFDNARVRNDVNDAVETRRLRPFERERQAGKRLAAAGRDGQFVKTVSRVVSALLAASG